jgi:hypothetical protein
MINKIALQSYIGGHMKTFGLFLLISPNRQPVIGPVDPDSGCLRYRTPLYRGAPGHFRAMAKGGENEAVKQRSSGQPGQC